VGEFLYGQLLARVAPEALFKVQDFIASFEIFEKSSEAGRPFDA
jgi:hypothetical protein